MKRLSEKEIKFLDFNPEILRFALTYFTRPERITPMEYRRAFFILSSSVELGLGWNELGFLGSKFGCKTVQDLANALHISLEEAKSLLDNYQLILDTTHEEAFLRMINAWEATSDEAEECVPET